MSKKVSILVGSLRKGSFARKIAQNVISMFPEGYEAQIVEIGHLPLYNFDYDDPAVTDFPTPSSYTEFRETIKASAGVLFVTSENNRTVPACLKTPSTSVPNPMPMLPGKKHRPASLAILSAKWAAIARKKICALPSHISICR